MSHRDADPGWPFRHDAKLSPRLEALRKRRQRELEGGGRIVHLSTWDYARACWSYWLGRRR